MKLSDYVIDFFAENNISHAFVISGGAVIHLADSADRSEKMEIIGTQHEQAAGAGGLRVPGAGRGRRAASLRRAAARRTSGTRPW